jgi:hypothetical protein
MATIENRRYRQIENECARDDGCEGKDIIYRMRQPLHIAAPIAEPTLLPPSQEGATNQTTKNNRKRSSYQQGSSNMNIAARPHGPDPCKVESWWCLVVRLLPIRDDINKWRRIVGRD